MNPEENYNIIAPENPSPAEHQATTARGSAPPSSHDRGSTPSYLLGAEPRPGCDAPYIKFSYPFVKMRRQTSAKIIHFEVMDVDQVDQDLREYDGLYYAGRLNPRYFNLPKTGKVLILYLIGNKGIPFTSIRPYTPEKEVIYSSLINIELTVFIKKSF